MRADEAPIGSPCEVDWDTMRSDDGGRRRWCGQCERHVHDLSQMGEAAARALLHETRGRELCIAYVEDEAGDIAFAAAPVVPLARLRRRPLVEAARLASAASIVALLGACSAHGDPAQAIRVEDDDPTQMLEPTTVIPARTPAEAPPVSTIVEPPAAEPCEPTEAEPPPPRAKPLPVKGGRKTGIRLEGSGSPLGGL